MPYHHSGQPLKSGPPKSFPPEYMSTICTPYNLITTTEQPTTQLPSLAVYCLFVPALISFVFNYQPTFARHTLLMILWINFLLYLCPSLVRGHATMVAPPSWFDVGGKGGLSSKARCADNGYEANNCKWFTNQTYITGEPTLPEDFRTYQDLDVYGIKIDFTRVNYQNIF